MREFYRRRLPHWQPRKSILFVTTRVAGTAPARRRHDPDVAWSLEQFEHLDDALHAAAGWSPLADARVAQIIVDAIAVRHEREFVAHRWVVMPNHLHLLIEPLPTAQGDERPVGEIMRSLKQYTATRANRLLGRRGGFWQDESFDRWMRDEDECLRVKQYIDRNPVAAGLCDEPAKWPWGSAWREHDAHAGWQPAPRDAHDA